MNFKKSQTYKNLQSAFAGESQAAMKYRFYSSQAKKDGYIFFSKVFEETAGNEKEHAEIWFKIIKNNGLVNGPIPKTSNNLKDAANGEKYEWTIMYDEFAKTAKKEGYNQIAMLFEKVGAIEKSHQLRYDNLSKTLKKNSVFVEKKEIYWYCLNCGALIKSKIAPKTCPICQHPQAYFVRKNITIG